MWLRAVHADLEVVAFVHILNDDWVAEVTVVVVAGQVPGGVERPVEYASAVDAGLGLVFALNLFHPHLVHSHPQVVDRTRCL